MLARLDKYTLQTLGFALVVLGIFLFMLGLIGGPTGTGPSCPLNGCPPWSIAMVLVAARGLVLFWHHSHHYRNHFACRRSKDETKAGLAQRDRGSLIRLAIDSPC